jgi:hypothetical protein
MRRTRAHAAVLAFRARSRRSPPRAGGAPAAIWRAPPPAGRPGIGSNALIVLFGGIETTEALIANACGPSSRIRRAHRARANDADLDRCMRSLRWDRRCRRARATYPTRRCCTASLSPRGGGAGHARRDEPRSRAPRSLSASIPGARKRGAHRLWLRAALLSRRRSLPRAQLAIRQLFDDWPALALDDQQPAAGGWNSPSRARWCGVGVVPRQPGSQQPGSPQPGRARCPAGAADECTGGPGHAGIRHGATGGRAR